MEQNQFDGLEEVEQEENLIPEEAPKMKEYEKLLLAENNRQLHEKAITLIRFGCFEQKEQKEIDFDQYTKIAGPKYRGLYDLYQNNETMELVFICPLVENNVGDDKEERKNMLPYAYDTIIIEHMDQETYELVTKAAKNNIRTSVSVLYYLSIIMYCVVAAVGLLCWLYYFITNADDYGFMVGLTYACVQCAPFMAGEVLGLIGLVLATIKYRAYKAK